MKCLLDVFFVLLLLILNIPVLLCAAVLIKIESNGVVFYRQERLRVDEIPQLWNVIKGDMSLVGPHSERQVFVDELAKTIPFYSIRHEVKPGVTGWAQVNYPYGASEFDALKKLEYDLYYMKNLSIAFDLMVIFKTVLFQKGSRE